MDGSSFVRAFDVGFSCKLNGLGVIIVLLGLEAWNEGDVLLYLHAHKGFVRAGEMMPSGHIACNYCPR